MIDVHRNVLPNKQIKNVDGVKSVCQQSLLLYLFFAVAVIMLDGESKG